jgi:hypothetical protein
MMSARRGAEQAATLNTVLKAQENGDRRGVCHRCV